MMIKLQNELSADSWVSIGKESNYEKNYLYGFLLRTDVYDGICSEGLFVRSEKFEGQSDVFP